MGLSINSHSNCCALEKINIASRRQLGEDSSQTVLEKAKRAKLYVTYWKTCVTVNKPAKTCESVDFNVLLRENT